MTEDYVSLSDIRTAELEVVIRHMVDVLDRGRWPSGRRLDTAERRIVEWHLELARVDRAELRADRANHARA